MPGLTIADAAIAIGGDLTGFDKDLKAGGDMVEKTLGAKLKEVFSPKRVAAGVGAGVGMALGQALNSDVAFAGFEKRMNEVFTLLPDMSQSAMGKMMSDVKAFARETGRTTAEVIPALYQAISAGIPPENVFDFLRTANKGASAGVATTADEVSLLTAVTKGFGDTSQEAVAKAADLAQLMVKLGQTTIPELAASYSKAVPLASALAISQEELAASSASLFGVTGNTAEVMTQQRAIFTALITQNPLLTAGLKEMGFETSKAAIESLGLQGTLDGLVKTTGGSTQALQGMLGSAEATTAALALTDAQAQTFTSNLDAMANGAGTVDTAFKRMDSGLDADARKLAATLETIGLEVGGFMAKFGPLPMILAQVLGPGLTRAIGGAFGGLAGVLSSRLGPTIATALLGPAVQGPVLAGSAGLGRAGGIAMGSAFGVAAAAAAGIGIALAFKSLVLDPGTQQQTRDIGKAVGEQIAAGTIEQLEQSRDALAQGIADLNALPLGGFLNSDAIKSLQTDLDAVNAKLLAAGEEMPQSVAAGIEQTAPAVALAVDELVKTLGTSMASVKAAARVTGADGMLAMAAGITAARKAPLDAFDTLKQMLKTAMSPMGEVARLHGVLTSKELARGMKSGDPAVRAQTIAVAKAAADRLGELAGQGGKTGKAAMAALDKGIRSKIPAVREASSDAKDAVVKKLDATKGPAGAAGAAAGKAFAAALKKAVAAGDFHVNASVGFTLPGVPSHAVGTTYVPRDMLSLIHRGEIIVPARESDAIRSGRATLGASGTGSGAGVTVHVYNPAPEPASTSTRRELRKLALSGSPM